MKKRAIFILLVFFFAMLTYSVLEPQIAYAQEASIDINLDSQQVGSGLPIKGQVNLQLIGKVSSKEEIVFTLGEDRTTFTLEEMLQNQGLSILYEDLALNVTEGSQQKTLTYNQEESKYLALQLPRFSEVQDISFNIAGSEVTSPTIDIGSEGTNDWFYLGEFIEYTETIQSPDFDDTLEGTGFIEDDQTYYCEVVELPLGKKFRVSAEYTKTGTEGDIHAVLLSVPTKNPEQGWSGGSDICDLPETSGSCEIDLQYPVEGTHMVCLYSIQPTTGDPLYEIPLDTSAETTTGFTCPVSENSLCESTGFTNFKVNVESGTYDPVLNTITDVPSWETFGTSVLTGIKNYVGSEPFSGVCKTTICSVPLNFTSLSAGAITISDLSVTYEFNGVVQKTNTLYDLQIPDAKITHIAGKNIEVGDTFTFELEPLGISTSNLGDSSLDISILGATSSESVSVVSPEEVVNTGDLINTAISNYDNYLQEKSDAKGVLQALGQEQGVKSALEELQTLKNEVGFTEERTLLSKFNTLVGSLPRTINIVEESSGIESLAVNEVPPSLGSATDFLATNNIVEVTASKKRVRLETYDGLISTYILIVKDVEAKKAFDGDLHEVAPISFNEIEFSDSTGATNANIVSYDVSFELGEIKSYYYLTEDDVALNQFATIIKEEVTAPVSTSFCGNNICESDESEASCPADCAPDRTSLGLIIVLIGVLGLVGFSVYYFIKKRKKKPVKGDASNAIVAYIKKAKQKGLSQDEITDSLRKRGWKDQQIKKAMNKK